MEYISFDRVYWYLQDCPLKRRSDPVIDEVPMERVYRKALTPGILELYQGVDSFEVTSRTVERIQEQSLAESAAELVAETSTLILAYSAMMLAQIPKGTILDTDMVLNYTGFLGEVDVVRRKEVSNLLQLVWVSYLPEYPDADLRVKLYQLAQWNGRLYELVHGERPFHLTYFLPLLGEFMTFTYNPDSRMELVAELIRMESLPARPGPQCDTCSACSMRYHVDLEKGDMNAYRFAW
jgi:hypothetical protein